MAELNNMMDGDPMDGAPLSPVEQAAIVLLSIGEEPAAAVLRCLSREELLEVTQVMSRLSGIKVDAVKTAMQSFIVAPERHQGRCRQDGDAVLLRRLPPAKRRARRL